MISLPVGPSRTTDNADGPSKPIVAPVSDSDVATGAHGTGSIQSFLKELIAISARYEKTLPSSGTLAAEAPDTGEAESTIFDASSPEEVFTEAWLDAGLNPEALDIETLRAMVQTVRAEMANDERPERPFREELEALVGTDAPRPSQRDVPHPQGSASAPEPNDAGLFPQGPKPRDGAADLAEITAQSQVAMPTAPLPFSSGAAGESPSGASGESAAEFRGTLPNPGAPQAVVGTPLLKTGLAGDSPHNRALPHPAGNLDGSIHNDEDGGLGPAPNFLRPTNVSADDNIAGQISLGRKSDDPAETAVAREMATPPRSSASAEFFSPRSAATAPASVPLERRATKPVPDPPVAAGRNFANGMKGESVAESDQLRVADSGSQARSMSALEQASRGGDAPMPLQGWKDSPSAAKSSYGTEPFAVADAAPVAASPGGGAHSAPPFAGGGESKAAPLSSGQAAPAPPQGPAVVPDALLEESAELPAEADAQDLATGMRHVTEGASAMRSGIIHASAMAQGDTVVHVSRQIATAIRNGSENSFDISLNQTELGKVRIHLAPTDGGISVSILADRPETLDLLRRHAELLAQEFRDLGYGAIDFSFASGDQPGQHSGHDTHESGPGAPASDLGRITRSPMTNAGETLQRPARDDAGRMDIRI